MTSLEQPPNSQKMTARSLSRAAVRGIAGCLDHKAFARIKRELMRISPDKVRNCLKGLIGEEVDVLFVHASLSSCGKILGGPEAVLSTWREQCSTLCVPTHTYCYPSTVGELGPVFDPGSTPSQVGLLTQRSCELAGAVRSLHPTHSIAAIGKRAEEICRDHDKCETPCGKNTPYEKLVAIDTSVLMFGTTMHAYTLFHTAEDASASSCAYDDTVDQLRVVETDRQIKTVASRRQSRTPRRFRDTDRCLESAGLLKRCGLGKGEILFIPSAANVHSFMVDRLRKHPDFLLESCSRPLI